MQLHVSIEPQIKLYASVTLSEPLTLATTGRASTDLNAKPRLLAGGFSQGRATTIAYISTAQTFTGQATE